ncbi:MBL fold metallo-hydrolase [Terrimonas sp. NA20]|uniref:MBL fold metallo-hydrolase n=1 Tax=Terrimonas ginsenosidimutans TaxID=2908004 RepID=A0ABS9KYY0_9BACT|nr:MBL fold metallo-hydrolase [Terrimonas ginsenosidimutans]MCG2617432.1 MBL fold metallo-hydrolase [Terrimonas ginsenosidimutans]
MAQVRLLRHATLVIKIDGSSFLVDPLLAKKDTLDPIIWTSNNIRNPMVDLPVSEAELAEIIDSVDGVIITHTHNDHWDDAARSLVPKDKLLIGQPQDRPKLLEQGYTNVTSIDKETTIGGLRIIRTDGQHGTGEIGAMMAPVSGFILQGNKESIYVAGDTIWCDEVAQAILQYQPDTIILNAGAAQFDKGEPITMTADDVLSVCRNSNATRIICVHMETINHCYLKRDTLRKAIEKEGQSGRCIVPDDGEILK